MKSETPKEAKKTVRRLVRLVLNIKPKDETEAKERDIVLKNLKMTLADLEELEEILNDMGKEIVKIFTYSFHALMHPEIKALTVIFEKRRDGIYVSYIPKKPEITFINQKGEKTTISMFDIETIESKQNLSEVNESD